MQIREMTDGEQEKFQCLDLPGKEDRFTDEKEIDLERRIFWGNCFLGVMGEDSELRSESKR